MSPQGLGRQPIIATGVQRGTEVSGRWGPRSLSKWPGLVGDCEEPTPVSRPWQSQAGDSLRLIPGLRITDGGSKCQGSSPVDWLRARF